MFQLSFKIVSCFNIVLKSFDFKIIQVSSRKELLIAFKIIFAASLLLYNSFFLLFYINRLLNNLLKKNLSDFNFFMLQKDLTRKVFNQ